MTDFEEINEPTNDDVIRAAKKNLAHNKTNIEASRDFAEGFIACLGFFRDGYDEAEEGQPYQYLNDRWAEYLPDKAEIDLHAKFKQIAATDGATKLVFEPSTSAFSLMPELFKLNGKYVQLSIYDPQLKLVLESDPEPEPEEVEGQERMEVGDEDAAA